eukprot:5051679-Karenia_brevis.AAC.1
MGKAEDDLEAGMGTAVFHTKRNTDEKCHRAYVAIAAVVEAASAQESLHQRRNTIEVGEGIQEKVQFARSILIVVFMHGDREAGAVMKDA